MGQTDTLVRIDGRALGTFSPVSPESGPELDLSSTNWNVTTHNANLSNFGGQLLISSAGGGSSSPTVVVTETVSVHVDLTTTPIVYANVTCDLGTQWVVSIGWPGWNPVNGSRILENLTRYPYLSAGYETKYNMIWLNSNYPISTNTCTGIPQLLRIDCLTQLYKLGLAYLPKLGGLQVKQIILPSSGAAHLLSVESLFVQSKPFLYASEDSHGAGSSLPDGSIVFTTNSTQSLWQHGWYPKRTYLQYSMDATFGTEYSVFAVLRANGTISLVRDPFVFRHATSGSSAGTFVDFVSPNFPNPNIEPLASLSATLADGDIAILFEPIGNNAISGVTMEFIQTSWSKLPFGDFRSTFALPIASTQILLSRGAQVIVLAAIVPSALMIALLVLLVLGRPLRSRNSFLSILAVGLVLRIILAPLSAANDTENFAAVASIYYSAGAFASEWVSFPGFVYLQTASYLPYALLRQTGFGDIQYLSLPIFALESAWVKIPSILADVGITYLMFKLARGTLLNRSGIIAGLYFLNPLTVYVSAVYGQFDSIFALLLLLGLYFGVMRRDSTRGGLLLGYAALVLPVGLVGLFPPAFARLREKNWKHFSIFISISGLVVILGLLPIALESKSPIFLTSVERLSHAIPGESVVEGTFLFSGFGIPYWSSIGYGLNYRFLLQLWGLQAGSIVYPLGAALGLVILTILMILAFWKSAKVEDLFPKSLFYVLGVVALFQLTYPTVFLQFAVWVVALLFVTYLFSRSPVLLGAGSAVSMLVGLFYVLFVDNSFAKATGVTYFQILNANTTNAIWATIGVAYSVILALVLFASVRALVVVNRK